MPDCIIYFTADTTNESITKNLQSKNVQEIIKDSEVKGLVAEALSNIQWSEDQLKVPDGVDWTKDLT